MSDYLKRQREHTAMLARLVKNPIYLRHLETFRAEPVAISKPILDAVTDKVLSYRPVDKGLAAKKTARKLKRKNKFDD